MRLYHARLKAEKKSHIKNDHLSQLQNIGSYFFNHFNVFLKQNKMVNSVISYSSKTEKTFESTEDSHRLSLYQ